VVLQRQPHEEAAVAGGAVVEHHHGHPLLGPGVDVHVDGCPRQADGVDLAQGVVTPQGFLVVVAAPVLVAARGFGDPFPARRCSSENAIDTKSRGAASRPGFSIAYAALAIRP
jgi:hypothetical protein